MFGPVDEKKAHSIITVHIPTKIMPLRYVTLPVGTYKVQGDVRSKLGHSHIQRLMASGVFSVEFVPATPSKVSARTQSPTPAEIVLPESETVVTTQPDTHLPGLVDPQPAPQKEVPCVEPPVPEAMTVEPEESLPDMTLSPGDSDILEPTEVPTTDEEPLEKSYVSYDEPGPEDTDLDAVLDIAPKPRKRRRRKAAASIDTDENLGNL